MRPAGEHGEVSGEVIVVNGLLSALYNVFDFSQRASGSLVNAGLRVGSGPVSGSVTIRRPSVGELLGPVFSQLPRWNAEFRNRPGIGAGMQARMDGADPMAASIASLHGRQNYFAQATGTMALGAMDFGNGMAVAPPHVAVETLRGMAYAVTNPREAAIAAYNHATTPSQWFGDLRTSYGRDFYGFGVASGSLLTETLGGGAVMRPLRLGGVPEGVVYLRIDRSGNLAPYIGQAMSEERFLARQNEHLRANPLADFEFTIIDRANPGYELDIAEHNRLQELTGGVRASRSDLVSNRVDPVGAARRERFGLPHPRER